MATHALNLFFKICMFMLVMWMVTFIPYDEGVNTAISQYIGFDAAHKIIFFILGETDPEPRDSLAEYCYIIINTIISVPCFSVVMSIINGKNFTKPYCFLKTLGQSIIRRYFKIIIYTFMFWLSLRFIPYEKLIHGNTSTTSLLLIIIFNLLISTVMYSIFIKLVKRTRSS